LDGVHKHSGRRKCKYAKPRSLPKFLFLKWWNKNKTSVGSKKNLVDKKNLHNMMESMANK